LLPCFAGTPRVSKAIIRLFTAERDRNWISLREAEIGVKPGELQEVLEREDHRNTRGLPIILGTGLHEVLGEFTRFVRSCAKRNGGPDGRNTNNSEDFF